MNKRYSVRIDNIPGMLRNQGIVAWVNDARHPDDLVNGAPISWHESREDAYAVVEAMNYVTIDDEAA